ncbi:MAG: hypothetical protein ACXVKH_07210 [Candidatus Angelobacter sp.]
MTPIEKQDVTAEAKMKVLFFLLITIGGISVCRGVDLKMTVIKDSAPLDQSQRRSSLFPLISSGFIERG